MSCEVVQELRALGLPLTEEAEVHARECGLCAMAAGEALPGPEAMPPGADDLFAAIEADQAAETGWAARLRALSTPRRLALAIAATAVVAVGSFIGSGRPDISVYPVARFAAEIAFTALLTWFAARAALRSMGEPPLSGRAIGLLLALAVIWPFALATLPMAHAAHPASLEGAGSDLVARALKCLAYGMACSAPLLVALGTLRRTNRRSSRRASVLAAAAGLGGLIGLVVHCPITQPIHLIFGHAPLILLVGLTWFAATRVLSPRTR